MVQRWSDLRPSGRRVLIIGGAADLALLAATLIDIRRRPAEHVRGPKWAWTAAMLANWFLGPLAYLGFGRRRAPAGTSPRVSPPPTA